MASKMTMVTVPLVVLLVLLAWCAFLTTLTVVTSSTTTPAEFRSIMSEQPCGALIQGDVLYPCTIGV